MDNHPITHKEIKFGKRFEQSRYVIKSKLSFGELVEIYCQLKERVLCQIYMRITIHVRLQNIMLLYSKIFNKYFFFALINHVSY